MVDVVNPKSDTTLKSMVGANAPTMSLGDLMAERTKSLQPYKTEAEQASKKATEFETEKAQFEIGQKEKVARAKLEGMKSATEKEEAAYREAELANQEMMDAKFVPHQDSAQDLMGLFTLMGIVGFAIGGGGKEYAQQAMAAQNGMLEGYQKGRADLYKKEKDKFDENVKLLREKARTVSEKAKRIAEIAAKDPVMAEQEALILSAQEGAGFYKVNAEKFGYAKAAKDAEDAYKAADKIYAEIVKEHVRAAKRTGRPQQMIGSDKKVYNFFPDGTVEVAQTPAGVTFTKPTVAKTGGGTAPAGANVTNDIESSAQAIANYAQKPPGLRDKTRPQIMARVREINPSYNEMDYGSREISLRNYTNPNGTGAKQLQAFTTVAGHLESLEVLGEALRNKDTQLVNKALNYIAVQTGSPDVTNFQAAKQAVAGEVVKAITGTAGALADRKEAEQIFSEVKSPEQLQGAIDTVKELIYSRLDTTRAHYESATGRSDFETRLPDVVKKTFIEKKKPVGAPAPQTSRKVQAPPEAVQYLKQHPEFKEQFKSKYGYLPEGM